MIVSARKRAVLLSTPPASSPRSLGLFLCLTQSSNWALKSPQLSKDKTSKQNYFNMCLCLWLSGLVWVLQKPEQLEGKKSMQVKQEKKSNVETGYVLFVGIQAEFLISKIKMGCASRESAVRRNSQRDNLLVINWEIKAQGSLAHQRRYQPEDISSLVKSCPWESHRSHSHHLTRCHFSQVQTHGPSVFDPYQKWLVTKISGNVFSLPDHFSSSTSFFFPFMLFEMKGMLHHQADS